MRKIDSFRYSQEKFGVTEEPELQIMSIFTKVVVLALLVVRTGSSVDIHTVGFGRMVQLDGFLLEWNKANAKPWKNSSLWAWDAIATKEGVTGYFKAIKPLACNGWNFTFLPRQLSVYTSMKLSASPVAPQTFYRVSQGGGAADSAVAAEWIIPWDSLGLDTTGSYRIGITGLDSCGDTLEPLILTGTAPRASTPVPWSKVYSKGILLAGLLIVLYFLQRSAKKKMRRTWKR